MFHMIASITLMLSFAAQPLAAAGSPLKSQTPPASQSLAAAMEQWISAIESDNVAAAERIAAGDKAAAEIKEHWQAMKENHKKFYYRAWIAGTDGCPSAEKIGDAATFEVGGHSYGHLHVEWTKSGGEWRIGKVWMCR
jgi:hypothetical protein